jgi:heme-degrading monooxygenase HmoA
MHMLIRHRVADFAKWKPAYDARSSARQRAGLKELHLFRNADDPNEVLLLFSVADVDKAKAFTASDDHREAVKNTGVSDKPDYYFLKYRLEANYAEFRSRSHDAVIQVRVKRVVIRSLLPAENRFQGAVRIEMIGSQPVAIEER